HSGAVRLWIDNEIARLNGRRCSLRRTAKVRTNPRKQFLYSERLGDVIIGAGVERLYLGALMLPHGKHHNWRRAPRADGTAHLYAADTRHHQVGDDEVGRPVVEDAQPLIWVIRNAHVVSLRGQRGAQHARNLWLVVDNQNSSRHCQVSFTGKITSSVPTSAPP